MLFSDENLLHIFGSDGYSEMWRRSSTGYVKINLKQTINYGE